MAFTYPYLSACLRDAALGSVTASRPFHSKQRRGRREGEKQAHTHPPNNKKTPALSLSCHIQSLASYGVGSKLQLGSTGRTLLEPCFCQASCEMGQACGHSLLCRSQQYRPAASEIKGQQVFLRAEEPLLHPDALQDALLRLASVTDSSSLQDAIRDTLQTLLSKVEGVFVYLLDVESGRLLCEAPHHELLTEGKLRDVITQQQRVQCDGLPPSELQEEQRSSLASPLPPDKCVLIIPLVDQDGGTVIALILVCCKQPTEAEEQRLNILEKHVTMACKRVQAAQRVTQGQVRSPSPSPSRSQHSLSETTTAGGNYNELDCKILRLCGELYDLDAASLQLKVIRYVSAASGKKGSVKEGKQKKDGMVWYS